MTGSNDSSSSHRQQQQQQEKEARAIRHFLGILRDRLDQSDTLQQILLRGNGSGYNDEDYSAERNALLQINNLGLREGLIVGVTTFAMLRLAPRYLSNRRSSRMMTMMQQQQQHQPRNSSSSSSSSYTLDPPPSSTNNTRTSRPTLFFLKAAKLGLDVLVSTVLAAYTSFYFTDEQIMLQTAASIPLVEGRSVLADEFCGVLRQEVHRYQKNDDKEFWQHVQSPYLRQLHSFVRNCERRRVYEEKLREEQGLSSEEPVKIPPPGVPVDFNILIDNNDDDFDENSGVIFGVDADTLQEEDSDAWARALVQAQGEAEEKEDDNK